MGWLFALGIVGGVLTTIAGLGGGIFLVVVLSLFRGTRDALAVTTPALLLSNLHRAVMFRAHLDRDVTKAFALGAVPGALAGGALVPALPAWILDAILVAMTLLALARSAGLFAWRPKAGALAPAGLGIGALAATSGGAGMMVSPVLLSCGLSGSVYIATMSACAVAMHAGRVAGYVVGGVLTAGMLPDAAVLLLGLVVGNALGKGTRTRLPPKLETRIELGALVVCTGLAVLGVAR